MQGVPFHDLSVIFPKQICLVIITTVNNNLKYDKNAIKDKEKKSGN